MAAVWGVPMTVIGGALFGWLGGWTVLANTLAIIWTTVAAFFFSVGNWPVRGRARWLVFGAAAVAGLAVASVVLMAVLSVDFAGTTPWHPSSINSFHDVPAITLVEERRTGPADCVQVCPKNVLEMDGKLRRVRVASSDACIACGACIVQCPEDALHFRYADGRVVEAATIRSTRLNMPGRRTVEL